MKYNKISRMQAVTSHVKYYLLKTETNRINLYFQHLSFFSDGTSAANYYKKPKITLYKTKVKFIWNSDIHLKAGKLVCVLPYIGTHIDAAINGATRRITDDKLHIMLAIIARNWTVIYVLQRHDFFWLRAIPSPVVSHSVITIP